MYYALKIIISALIIVLVSEVSRRSTFMGALTASLPLLSILSICWLYYETHDIGKVSSLSWEILWLVIPSLIFFAVFPWLLGQGRGFVIAMVGGVVATIAAYSVAIVLRRSFSFF